MENMNYDKIFFIFAFMMLLGLIIGYYVALYAYDHDLAAVTNQYNNCKLMYNEIIERCNHNFIVPNFSNILGNNTRVG